MVQKHTAARRMTGSMNHFHHLTVSQPEAIAIGNRDNLRLIADRYKVFFITERTHPVLRVRHLLFKVGNVFFRAVNTFKLPIASGMVAVVMGDDNIQRFSFSNIDKFSTAGLITRMTTDVTNVQNAYQMCLRIAVRAPFMLVFSLGAAICIDWQLSVIFLAFIPVLGAGLYLVASHAHPIFERVFRLYDRLNGVVGEKVLALLTPSDFPVINHYIESYNAKTF